MAIDHPRVVVVFHDVDPCPPKILATLWSAGDLIDQTPHSYGIRTWADAVSKLEELRNIGIIVTEVHFWSHGYRKGPVLGCREVSPGVFRHRYEITDLDLIQIGQAAPMLRILWWRCCDTGTSYEFPLRVQAAIPTATTVHHAAVISGEKTYKIFGKSVTIPSPWWQDNGCALPPGHSPWWDTSGDGLRGCLVTAMKVPRSFYPAE